MELEDKVSGAHTGLTEEQKERILNEVERERRKVLVLKLVSEGLHSTDVEVKIGTTHALEALASTMPDEFIEMYQEYIHSQDRIVKHGFVDALSGLSTTRQSIAAEFCEAVLNDEDISTRSHTHKVVEALAKVLPKKAAQLYQIAIDSEQPFALPVKVTKALSVLVDAEPQMAIELYEKGLRSKNDDVRRKTAAELGTLARVDLDKFVELYRRGLNDPDGDVITEIAKAVAAVVPVDPDRAMELYEEGICNKEAFVRIGTAEALPTLIKCDSNRVIVLYERALKDKVDLVRIAAAEALPTLVLINPDKAAQLYARALKDREELVRQAAAAALPFLSSVRPDSAARLYEKALRDKDGGVNMAAACGIDDLAAVRPSIAEELRKKALKSKCESVRDAAEGKLFYPTPLREGTAAERRYRELRREERKVITDEVERLLNILRRSPTEFIRAYQERATTREGLEGELKLDYAWEVTSKPLIHLIETIDAETLTPIYDEERTFIQAYLESRCIRLDGDKKKGVKEADQLITELRRLVQNPNRDYGKLMRILEAGKAKDLDEILECAEITVEDYLLIRKLGFGAIKKAYLGCNLNSGHERVFLVIDPNLKGFQHYANIRGDKNIDELLATIYKDEFSAVNLNDLPDKKFIGIVAPPRKCHRRDEVLYCLEMTEYETTLEEVLKERTADEKTLFRYIHQIAFALMNCEKKGIAHKDLKPDNIGIDNNSNIILSDFGCTSMFSDTAQSRYQYPLVLRPPELAHGDDYWEKIGVKWQSELFTPEANVWTLGAIVYRMFMSGNIFEGPQKRAAPGTDEYHEQNRRVYEQIQQFDTIRDKVLDDIKIRNGDAARVVDLCLKTDPAERSDALTKIVELTKEYA